MKTKTVKPRAAAAPRRNTKGSAPASAASCVAGRALVENPGPPKRSKRPGQRHASEAGREARPATPGAGVPPGSPLWQLRLYVMGRTLKSLTAFANLKQFCESHLQGRYRITVIDLVKQPQLARGDQILAIPTVVRRLPKPARTLIGTLSDTARVLVGLDLRAAE